MPLEHRVLLLEDNANDAYLTRMLLRGIANIVAVNNRDDYEHLLSSVHTMLFSLILADVRVPGFREWDALEIAKKNRPSVPFIYLSGSVTDHQLAEAMKLGALDCVQKDRIARLEVVIKRLFNLPV